MPTLDIVIVNWNSRHQLRECLESIVAADQTTFDIKRIVIVDNASADGSVNGLESFNLPVVVIRNLQNLGFSKAVNRGIEGSQADYILLLNPDTRLFSESLCKPIAFLQQSTNQHIGILGLPLIDSHNEIARTCVHFPTPYNFTTQAIGLDHLFPTAGFTPSMWEWDHQDSRPVDHVMAAYYLTRRKVFDSVGGMDERFFVYYEDLDFSLRAKQAGWQSFYFADAQLYHKGGGSSEQVKAQRLFYSLDSRMKYAWKHFSWLGAAGYTLSSLFIEAPTRIAYAILKRRPAQIVETLKAYTLFWQSLLRRLFR